MQFPEDKLKIFPSTTTFNDAIKYGIYHKKARNGDSKFGYVGLYQNKSVKAIGKIENIVYAELIEDDLIIQSSDLPVTLEQASRIKNLIKHRDDADISKKHKFFCVEKFELTDFIKSTSNGVQGSKLFNLKKYLSDNELQNISKISQALKFKTWE